MTSFEANIIDNIQGNKRLKELHLNKEIMIK